jgi:hypothetical protein
MRCSLGNAVVIAEPEKESAFDSAMRIHKSFFLDFTLTDQENFPFDLPT